MHTGPPSGTCYGTIILTCFWGPRKGLCLGICVKNVLNRSMTSPNILHHITWKTARAGGFWVDRCPGEALGPAHVGE